MARRTLPHPPSDRYAASGGEVAPRREPGTGGEVTTGASTAAGRRAEWAAVSTAIGTGLVLAVVGGVLASTTGLLFVAGVGGALVGLLLAGSARPPSRLRPIAVGLALAAVATGALGTWLVARGEGGALGPLDFLWATTGLLVPAELIVAALAALWGVRTGPIRG